MNNQIDKIVNLSHLILNKIVNYLDNNIDIICFSLACKRWYNDRDKYLVFNTDNIDLFTFNTTDTNQNHKHFKLPSYNNILLKSIQSKTKCTLSVGYNQKTSYDYHFDILLCIVETDYFNFKNIKDDVRNLKSIPNSVSTIEILSDREDEQEYLYRLISESQSVTKLNGCSTLKYGLPKSIKSLKMEFEFNEPLAKGLLPNSLEVLDFEDPLKQEIPPGVLPDALRKLYLDRYRYEFLPGVFQLVCIAFIYSTINMIFDKVKLYLLNYQYEILQGALPDGLQKFNLDGYQHEIQPGVLPSSLKSLSLTSYSYSRPIKEELKYSIDSAPISEDSTETESFLPISWLQAISSLSNLRSLDIYYPIHNRHDTIIFNLNYLPPTLETLDITLKIKKSILKGTMPTSLKKIRLVDCPI
ncbi:hypothetical protein PPL_10837 [Heterostelium album PN500]|uniref:F-box domain-containing protein n=1 Tax=Heterostelium pallidum (strain ATCC 26659 / Pp 5 / PN500) TaxID=670386 RepID=D3BS45_HETP5|nr:hypothetical protein PPL_10837 [Heterostelium album PN500]EFA75782.1 hypothetical protein PPL_10837 [Heterostelium album PN500]|eukprot:XP_020427916.1 hypothetical protein PPL_10837 [Heterostelium album PN500]